MTPKNVSKQLRIVQEAYKDAFTPTFQPRISDMAKDAADAIDQLQSFVDHIHSLPDCNTCSKKSCCIYAPGLGKTVRYNCFLFEK